MMGPGAHVATFLVLLVVLTLFGFSILMTQNGILSEIDSKLFFIPAIFISFYLILKFEIPKLNTKITSKILTVFLCFILLSSVFTGFANFSSPQEVFAEEEASFEGIIEDSNNLVTSNSTSTETVDASDIPTNSTDSSLDPLVDSVDSITSNSTSTETVDASDIPTNSTDSSLDPLVDSVDSITSNSTSTEPMDASNMYFVAWNEDRHPTYKTYGDALTIKPLSVEYGGVESVEEYLQPSFDVDVEELLMIDDSIPYWVKPYAGSWINNEISDYEFFNSLEPFIDNDAYLQSTDLVDAVHSDNIPDWVKQYVRLWVDDKISNSDFIYVVGHLVKTGVLSNPDVYSKHVSEITKNYEIEKYESKSISDLTSYVTQWKDGILTDDEFFNMIYLAIFNSPSEPLSITDTFSSDQIPNWLKQHATKLKDSAVPDHEIVSIIYNLLKSNLMEN